MQNSKTERKPTQSEANSDARYQKRNQTGAKIVLTRRKLIKSRH
jgi:hypothetical protein